MTGGGPCRAHPSDPDVFFTKGPNDWTIRKWMLGKKPGYVDLNVMGGFPRGVPPDGMFAAMALALDRRHPEVMYVANAYDNVPLKFFRTTDGGATWENLTEGFPGVFMRGLEVSPVTGEVFIGTPNGSRVLPPPYADAAPAARAAMAADVWGQRYPRRRLLRGVGLHRSATCRHMAGVSALAVAPLGVRVSGAVDAGRGRLHPCDHDAVQRRAAQSPRPDAARSRLAGRAVRAFREILPALGGGAGRGKLHLDDLFRRGHAAAAARPGRGLPAGLSLRRLLRRDGQRRLLAGVGRGDAGPAQKTPWLLTTRFDNDDALAGDFVARLQAAVAAAAPPARGSWNFPRGFVLEGGKLYAPPFAVMPG